MYFKVNINYAFFTFLHFFWISFFYLYFFFLFYFIFLFYKNWTHTTIYVLLIFFFWLIETQTSYFGNLTLSFLHTNLLLANTLLFNNLNKYHPIILYYSFCIIVALILFIWKYVFFNLCYEKLYCIFKFLISNFFLFFFYINSALFLGAWWAEQEGSWGGWWNWDPSENLGLLLSVFILFNIHIRLRFFFVSRISLLVLYKFFFLLFFFYYFFLQLNFDIVSHNFGIKFLFFFNNNNFLVWCSFFFFVNLFSIMFYFTQFKVWLKLLAQLKTIPNLEFFPFIFSFLFTLLLLISLVPLINFFLWKVFSLVSFDTLLQFAIFKLYFLCLLLFSLKKFRIGFFFFLITDLWSLFFLSGARFYKSFSFFIHFSLALIFFLITFSNVFIYLQYALNNSLYLISFHLHFFFFMAHSVATDSLYLKDFFFNETSFSLFLNLKLTDVFSSLILISFYFFFSLFTFFKYYLFTTTLVWSSTFLFWIYSSFFSQLAFITLYLIVTLFVFFKNKFKIN